jgi:hypothetical protein
MLAKDPAARPQTMDEVMRPLEAFLGCGRDDFARALVMPSGDDAVSAPMVPAEKRAPVAVAVPMKTAVGPGRARRLSASSALIIAAAAVASGGLSFLAGGMWGGAAPTEMRATGEAATGPTTARPPTAPAAPPLPVVAARATALDATEPAAVGRLRGDVALVSLRAPLPTRAARPGTRSGQRRAQGASQQRSSLAKLVPRRYAPVGD